jgi:Holliday junction resolvase RusA-like endonuclease
MPANFTMVWEGVPIGKGRPRAFATKKGIRTYTPDKTVEFEETLRYHMRREMGVDELFQLPCRVEIEARFPIPKSYSKASREIIDRGGSLPHTVKPDADNVLKAVMDAMNGIVFEDDKLACDVRITKRYSRKPGLTVYVSEI